MKKVVVDVYSWITAAKEHPSIPIEGIYRHAKSLALKFRPAVLLSPNEVTDFYETYGEPMQRIASHLRKPITVYVGLELLEQQADVWLSIALDAACPRLPELNGRLTRVAVLHDTMAYHGLFGAGNVRTFHIGNENNDILLPVSEYARDSYLSLQAKGLTPIKSFIPYGCFHTLSQLPPIRPHEAHSVSVSTVYPRKRIAQTLAFASAFLPFEKHYHIGRYVKSEDEDRMRAMFATSSHCELMGFVLDDKREDIVSTASAYLNFSEDEGFSMPPMEAIISGVPMVFLSDIPVHREIYGEVANFQDPTKRVDWANVRTISEEDRKAFFDTWSFDRVIQPFISYLSHA